MAYKIAAHGLSDIGLVRLNNEDVFVLLPELRFFALADGMGGHQAGEVAAKESVDMLCERFSDQLEKKSAALSLREALQLLKHSIEYTNHKVYQMGRANPELRGMGTTLCCMYFHPQGLIYAHVGDSRIYRFRKGILQQLTMDHTLYRELLEMGQIEESVEARLQYKNIITKAIGTESSIEPSVYMADVEKNDIYLTCSDGLTDMLGDPEIQEILKHYTALEECAKRLISKAKVKGGHDNITVVLVRVLPLDEKKSVSRQ